MLDDLCALSHKSALSHPPFSSLPRLTGLLANVAFLSSLSVRDDKKKLFVRMLTTMSAKEQFWLMRMILKGSVGPPLSLHSAPATYTTSKACSFRSSHTVFL